jgi:hypothetical protein
MENSFNYVDTALLRSFPAEPIHSNGLGSSWPDGILNYTYMDLKHKGFNSTTGSGVGHYAFDSYYRYILLACSPTDTLKTGQIDRVERVFKPPQRMAA